MQSVSTKSGEKEEMLNIYIKKSCNREQSTVEEEKNSFIKLKKCNKLLYNTLYFALLLNFVGQQLDGSGR